MNRFDMNKQSEALGWLQKNRHTGQDDCIESSAPAVNECSNVIPFPARPAPRPPAESTTSMPERPGWRLGKTIREGLRNMLYIIDGTYRYRKSAAMREAGTSATRVRRAG